MPQKEALKKKVGDTTFLSLEKLANEEVALAMKMPLEEHFQKKYYSQRPLRDETLDQSRVFHEAGLAFSPLDIVNVLFKIKIFFACSSPEEYQQRSGSISLVDEVDFALDWTERSKSVDELTEQYLSRIHSFVKDRTLVTTITNFNNRTGDLEQFFNSIFSIINAPYKVYLNNETLIEKHKILEPHLKKEHYTAENAKRFFNAPSICFTTRGTSYYAYFYATTWLRTFLNVLRISAFIYPGQVDFGMEDVDYKAPLGSVFLGNHSQGAFCWDEDKKKPWLKVPDGSLFLSFGYRGLSKIWLDERTFPAHLSFFTENKIIFEKTKNPWSPQYQNDITPALEILSSASQIQDLGAKILLIYCCLEHLFVPSKMRTDNKKYIVGGINALRPSLLSWFNELYDLRCEYAHKGFVIKTDSIRSLVRESTQNVFKLLIAKIESIGRST